MICFNCNSIIKEGAGFVIYATGEYFCEKSCAEFYYDEIVGVSIEKAIEQIEKNNGL
jgi:hypothetical protein